MNAELSSLPTFHVEIGELGVGFVRRVDTINADSATCLHQFQRHLRCHVDTPLKIRPRQRSVAIAKGLEWKMSRVPLLGPVTAKSRIII